MLASCLMRLHVCCTVVLLQNGWDAGGSTALHQTMEEHHTLRRLFISRLSMMVMIFELAYLQFTHHSEVRPRQAKGSYSRLFLTLRLLLTSAHCAKMHRLTHMQAQLWLVASVFSHAQQLTLCKLSLQTRGALEEIALLAVGLLHVVPWNLAQLLYERCHEDNPASKRQDVNHSTIGRACRCDLQYR